MDLSTLSSAQLQAMADAAKAKEAAAESNIEFGYGHARLPKYQLLARNGSDKSRAELEAEAIAAGLYCETDRWIFVRVNGGPWIPAPLGDDIPHIPGLSLN